MPLKLLSRDGRKMCRKCHRVPKEIDTEPWSASKLKCLAISNKVISLLPKRQKLSQLPRKARHEGTLKFRRNSWALVLMLFTESGMTSKSSVMLGIQPSLVCYRTNAAHATKCMSHISCLASRRNHLNEKPSRGRRQSDLGELGNVGKHLSNPFQMTCPPRRNFHLNELSWLSKRNLATNSSQTKAVVSTKSRVALQMVTR